MTKKQPKINIKTVQMSFKLPFNTAKNLGDVCEQDDVTISDFVNDALEFWIDERNMRKFLNDALEFWIDERNMRKFLEDLRNSTKSRRKKKENLQDAAHICGKEVTTLSPKGESF